MPLRAADAGARDVGIAVLLIQLEANGGPDGGGRGPRTRDSPAIRPPAIARSAIALVHNELARAPPVRRSHAAIFAAAIAACAFSMMYAGAPAPRIPIRAPAIAATDHGRRAPERAAGARGARSALWQPDPADFGHPVVRHPPRSGWLDELGRLKGGRPSV